MMTNERQHKVQATHLKRSAYVYVRQSSPRQVKENKESTERQYALREQAVALGWPIERVIIVDHDQAKTAANPEEREAFEKLVTEVGMGRAGLVCGLEVQRLARNSVDWQRLLEMCALTETLVLDEDGLYDPKVFNDRILLSLKGVFSEAEHHVIRARLQGGALNKAQRGALEVPIPAGFVYDPTGKVELDPDKQVQGAVRLLFETFRRIGTAFGTAREFREKKLLFPVRLKKGPRRGQLLWQDLGVTRALQLLHNPRYAGAFCWGRTRQRKRRVDGRLKNICEKRPREEWILIPNLHKGYIAWEEFEENQRRLRENAAAHGNDRRRGPAREGPALLQGLIVCGKCGLRMTVQYHKTVDGALIPKYSCSRNVVERAEKTPCQVFRGDALDEAVGRLLVDSVTPMALEVALTVQKAVESRVEEVDRLRKQQTERARYEAELARHRFMAVDPNNRLVADALEADWNEKLRALTQAQEEYQRSRDAEPCILSDEQRASIAALATDFPRLWQDPRTPMRERKRMVRLLLEDVTVVRGEQITAHVRFRGGPSTTLTLPLPLKHWERTITSPEVVAEVDKLLDKHLESDIARLLNERGVRSGQGRRFNVKMVIDIRNSYSLKSRYERLRETGLLTLKEVAKGLRVKPDTVKRWLQRGLLRAQAYSNKNECLFEPPGADAPVRGKRKDDHRRPPTGGAQSGRRSNKRGAV